METEPITEGQYFHIYNRGVNGETIFKEKRNYEYFLRQYRFYCAKVIDTYAYCLLKNHFHLLVYIKPEIIVPGANGKGLKKLNASKQLSHFFNSYAQSINKAYNRTGPLFESPFERRSVTDDGYLISLVRYCHQNPQLHGLVNNFKDWEFSSYHTIVSNDNSFVHSQNVIGWFSNIDTFKKAHSLTTIRKGIENYLLE